MSTVTASPTATTTRSRRAPRRAAAVLGAVVATSVLQVAASALGVDFLLRDEMGSVVLTLPIVAVATAIFGLLGWGSIALLEKITRRGRGIWTALAVTVTLVLIHLAVAAALVPALRHLPHTHHSRSV